MVTDVDRIAHGVGTKRLSSIQSQTNDMITRLNELHKHRLNLIKLKDRLMRTFDVIETWGQITGAALMLVPTPMTQMFGVAMIGASVVSGICESWREYTLEKKLNQKMDDGDQAFEALKQGLMADYSDHGIATLQYVEDDANVALIDSDMDDPGQQILVEYSSAIADLVAAEQQLLTSDTHGFFNQDRAIRSGNQSLGDQFIGTDDNNRRGILNTLNVGMYKDHLRILQEKMRTVYVISSIVSDAIATIAANVGDMEKVNVANGLKRIFESRFSIINMTMDLQEQLLKQYETMVGHNFSVDKMRYDRTVGLGVSSATVLTLG